MYSTVSFSVNWLWFPRAALLLFLSETKNDLSNSIFLTITVTTTALRYQPLSN